MTWVRIECSLTDHPKMLSLGEDAAACYALFVASIAWSQDHGTDGFIPTAALGRVCYWWTLVETTRLAERLKAVRFYEDTQGGYLIHDFADYQPTEAESKRKLKQKREAGRRGGVASGAKRKEAAKQRSATESKQPLQATASTDCLNNERTNERTNEQKEQALSADIRDVVRLIEAVGTTVGTQHVMLLTRCAGETGMDYVTKAAEKLAGMDLDSIADIRNPVAWVCKTARALKDDDDVDISSFRLGYHS